MAGCGRTALTLKKRGVGQGNANFAALLRVRTPATWIHAKVAMSAIEYSSPARNCTVAKRVQDCKCLLRQPAVAFNRGRNLRIGGLEMNTLAEDRTHAAGMELQPLDRGPSAFAIARQELPRLLREIQRDRGALK